MSTIPVVFAVLYGLAAALDLALCLTGRYKMAGVTIPAFAGFRAGSGLGVAYLAASHAAVLWWLLDAGWYGQMELPGALMGFLFLDALARVWRLRTSLRRERPRP